MKIFLILSERVRITKSNLSVVCSAISKCAKYIETDICQYLNAKYFYKHERRVATEQKNVEKSQLRAWWGLEKHFKMREKREN